MIFEETELVKSAKAREQLQSLVDRLSRSVENADKREIYKEAKEAGFDNTALRAVVKFAKMDKADAEVAWSVLSLYMTYTILQ